MGTKSISIHSDKEFSPLIQGIEVSPFMKLNHTEELAEVPLINLKDLNVSEKLYCSYCNVGFLDQAQQRQHYKLDWHRYNLKQHLCQKKSVSEEKFSQLADDVSSISGSESESEIETEFSSTDIEAKAKEDNERLNHLIARKSRLLFNNSNGQVISIHRCLVLNKKEEAVSDARLIYLFQQLPSRNTWLIIMLSGGHFAAAILKGGEAIIHKTFHCYTVRAKQGGTQSSKDNKSSHSKSAGASLRRYNEQSLIQHVQELMKSWGPEINKCDAIFYRAVGRGNTGVLFNGSNPPLLKSDPRLRSIPFTTRRPTFSEVQRVYTLLSTAFIYDSHEMFRVEFSPKKTEKNKQALIKEDENKENKKKTGSPRIDRAKERPSPVRELPKIIQQLVNESSESEDGSYIIECVEQEVLFSDRLKEFEDTVPEKVKKKKIKKKKIIEERETFSPEQLNFWKQVHGSCEDNNTITLKEALEKCLESLSKDEVSNILNLKNIEGQTILHKMASESKGDIIRLLLFHGCDPCIKDKKSLTPYDACLNKTTRSIFRRFMGEFPDMYDYSKSHIPNALTETLEAEIAEKKKAARKVKRQKDKEKKQAQEIQKQEEEEKQRFLKLSDREKCALAAERRLLALSGKAGVVLQRCYICAEDMTGKVPFEYESYRFCSMPCLKAHRKNRVVDVKMS